MLHCDNRLSSADLRALACIVPCLHDSSTCSHSLCRVSICVKLCVLWMKFARTQPAGLLPVILTKAGCWLFTLLRKRNDRVYYVASNAATVVQFRECTDQPSLGVFGLGPSLDRWHGVAGWLVLPLLLLGLSEPSVLDLAILQHVCCCGPHAIEHLLSVADVSSSRMADVPCIRIVTFN